MLTKQSWEDTYINLCLQGFMMKDMPSANHVWGAYLLSQGFRRYIIPDTCPDCYTIADFCRDNPHGEYMLATGTHVVACKDGDYFDSWDSGSEVPVFYWKREEN